MIRRPPRSTLSLHDALPISRGDAVGRLEVEHRRGIARLEPARRVDLRQHHVRLIRRVLTPTEELDPKSTRLNSRHLSNSDAGFRLENKKDDDAHASVVPRTI